MQSRFDVKSPVAGKSVKEYGHIEGDNKIAVGIDIYPIYRQKVGRSAYKTKTERGQKIDRFGCLKAGFGSAPEQK